MGRAKHRFMCPHDSFLRSYSAQIKAHLESSRRIPCTVLTLEEWIICQTNAVISTSYVELRWATILQEHSQINKKGEKKRSERRARDQQRSHFPEIASSVDCRVQPPRPRHWSWRWQGCRGAGEPPAGPSAAVLAPPMMTDYNQLCLSLYSLGLVSSQCTFRAILLYRQKISNHLRDRRKTTENIRPSSIQRSDSMCSTKEKRLICLLDSVSPGSSRYHAIPAIMVLLMYV